MKIEFDKKDGYHAFGCYSVSICDLFYTSFKRVGYSYEWRGKGFHDGRD